MTLVSTLSPAALATSGTLKWIAGDPIGGGSLTGVVEPTGHPGWVLANGAQLANSGKFVTLYGICGTKFGAAGTLPPIIDGRIPLPKGAVNFPTVGVVGGEINHVLTLAEFTSHYHTYSDSVDSNGRGSNHANLDGWDPWDRGGNTRTTNSAGGGGSHNNMPPYVVVGFVLVKL